VLGVAGLTQAVQGGQIVSGGGCRVPGHISGIPEIEERLTQAVGIAQSLPAARRLPQPPSPFPHIPGHHRGMPQVGAGLRDSDRILPPLRERQRLRQHCP
jgi:hypothetical protein